MTANKSFERTVKRRGRAVLAMDGVLGGAEMAALAGRSIQSLDRIQMITGKTFRHSAAFGKRMEYWIIGRMLKEGLDVYVPLVDDHAVDAIIKRPDGSTALVQIKARSKDVIEGDAALFAAIPHPELRENYWFVFYSERMDAMWIMSSKEFISESVQNKSGKNAGLRSIWFNGKRRNKVKGCIEEYCKPQWEKYLAKDFSRIVKDAV